MSNASRRGPRELSEILGELFTVRGYGRLQARGELENAWNNAVGEPHCRQTRLGEIRRGVITVIVSHPTLLEELAAFRKAELLAALRACAPGETIHDLRFRVGTLTDPAPGAVDPRPSQAAGQPPSVSAAGRRRSRSKPSGRRRGSPARENNREGAGG